MGGLIHWMDTVFGGAVTTVAAALMGRLVFHGTEVKAKRRRFFGRELWLEFPIVVAMAVLAEAIASRLGWSHEAATGAAAVLAWLGPKGSAAILEGILTKRAEK